MVWSSREHRQIDTKHDRHDMQLVDIGSQTVENSVEIEVYVVPYKAFKQFGGLRWCLRKGVGLLCTCRPKSIQWCVGSTIDTSFFFTPVSTDQILDFLRYSESAESESIPKKTSPETARIRYIHRRQ